MFFKKIISIVSAAVILSLSFIPVLAENVKCDENKSSFECYAGQGNLKCTSEDIYGFDDTQNIYSKYQYISDGDNKKEGVAALSFSIDEDKKQATLFSTGERAFDFGITDPLKQTVKMWVYVNDVDLIECDHDSVYENPQKNCGTMWIEFAEHSGKQYKYVIQHTFQGSGWHLIEIAFNTDNVIYKTRTKMDISRLQWMKIRANVKKGLQISFDGLKKYTYSNDGYEQPECPNNGRWISTCDFDALDGSIVTEWLGSSFDTKEKTQGSSSLTLTAHKEHVDFRCVWSGLDMPLYRETDNMHMDIFVSDINDMSDNLQMRLSQSEGGDGYATYSLGYGLIDKFANDGEGLKTGWNSVDFPLMLTSANIDMVYYKKSFEFRLDRVTIFWEGASEDKEYTVKYDNMYMYTRDKGVYGDIPSDDAPVEDTLKAKNEDKNDQGKKPVSTVKIAAIAASASAAAVIIAVVVLVIIIKKRKNCAGK